MKGQVITPTASRKFRRLSPKEREFLGYKGFLEKITAGLKTPTTLPNLARRRKMGQFVYSTKMEKFVKQYEPALTHSLELIHNVITVNKFWKFTNIGISKFKGDKWLFDRKTKTSIRVKASKPTYEREPDGVEVYSSSGNFLIHPFHGMNARFIIGGAQLTNKYLRRIKYKIGKFNVRVAEPHIFYDQKFDVSYLVTDFYEGSTERFEIAKHWDLVNPISTLKEYLSKQGIKVEPRNILIRLPRSQFGEKTILLWDLLA